MRQAEASDEIAERLLMRVARADIKAFEALYELYCRPVYSLAVGMLRDPEAAEEVTQEAFIAIWRQAAEFDPGRGTGRSWILALAHHKSVDAIRRQRFRNAERLSESAAHDLDVVSEAMRRVEADQVRNALMTLSSPQREAIALAYFGGYSQREIAARLQLPLGTVKTRIRDGMLRLRALLAQAMEGRR